MRPLPHAAMVIVMIAALVSQTQALPRFASRTGTKCQACHLNPSGGGLRQPFGVQYGRDKLPVPTWSEEFDLDDFSTQLTDFVSVGADFRTLYFYQQNPDTGVPARSVKATQSFWQMQGDLYLSLRLAKKVAIYLDKGLYPNTFEIFGLLNILPENGHIKVGKFVPNYGTKMDDHRSYIRMFTGFSPEGSRPELTGAEVSIMPGPVSLTGGVYNASDPVSGLLGATNDKALLGRAEGMFKAASDITVGLGGNVFTKKKSSGPRTTLFGGFGSFSYRELTLLGEMDLIQNKPAGGTKTTGIVTFLEVNYMLTPGLDVKLAYEFYDRDKDFKTGAQSKYGIGFEFFPIAGVEVRPVYRIVKDEPTDVKNDEFQVLFHFYL